MLGSFEKQMVSGKELDDFLHKNIEILQDIIAKYPEDDISPSMLVMIKKDYNSGYRVAPVLFNSLPEDQKERSDLIRDIGAQMWRERRELGGYPVAVVFASEVWFKKLKKDQKMTKNKVSDYKSKHEGIAVFGCTIQHLQNMALYEIKRDKNSKILSLDLDHDILSAESAKESKKLQANLVEQFFYGMARESDKELKEVKKGVN